MVQVAWALTEGGIAWHGTTFYMISAIENYLSSNLRSSFVIDNNDKQRYGFRPIAFFKNEQSWLQWLWNPWLSDDQCILKGLEQSLKRGQRLKSEGFICQW